MFTNRLQNVATTFQLIGGVFLASAFIEPIVSGNFSFIVLVTGFILSLGFFCASFYLAKKMDFKV